jgi:nitrite reductase/ring-hydroxylating ferredoxin subunit
MSKSSRRAFISGSIASFTWLLTGGQASGAAPAITAGAPCKPKGRERTVDGVTYVCRNVKGKLVWRGTPVEVKQQVFTARVLESSELVLGSTKVVNVPTPIGGTTGVVVTRTDVGITALAVACTHAGFPVARVGNVLECELHGSKFEPTTGAVLGGPAVRALLRYDATETNGGVYVTVTSG